ncbi:MAG: hypothetical protein HQL27_04215 [Candidatus Omnitrophica bacterium]|nr:hypothetical protein [Candidatus Omnitrophota bacterium]
MKINLIKIPALFLLIFLFFVPSAQAKRMFSWSKEGIDISEYKFIQIYSIDVRGMKIEDYDHEERANFTEDFDASLLEETANNFYVKMNKYLKEFLPIKEAQEVVSTDKGLVLECKIKGVFNIDGTGLLNKMIFKGRTSVTDLTLECRGNDSQSKKDIFEYKDTRPYSHPLNGEPLKSDEEMVKLGLLFEVWAEDIYNELSGN